MLTEPTATAVPGAPPAVPAVAPTSAVSPSTPRDAADNLIAEMNRMADRIHAKHRRDMVRALYGFAPRLARIPDDLVEYLVTKCHFPADLILKARELGRGLIPDHIFLNDALRLDTIKALPESDKAELFDPKSKIVIRHKHRTRTVTPADLADDPVLTRRLISARCPDRGVMKHADQQRLPRPYPPGEPVYFRPIKIERGEGDLSDKILVTLESKGIKTCTYKAAFTRDEVGRMMAEFERA